jgi:hypothetical protein
MKRMTLTAECACGRLQVSVVNEPMMVAICHCDFCQKRRAVAFRSGRILPRRSCRNRTTQRSGLCRIHRHAAVPDDDRVRP